MTLYKLDAKTSESVYRSVKREMEPKMCYNNVFKTVSKYFDYFNDGRWKVAYGYMRTLPTVFCRHCFILDAESNLVIDPTIFASGMDTSEREYYIFKVFDTLEDYTNALDEADRLPALDYYLCKEDNEAQLFGFENGLIFIG